MIINFNNKDAKKEYNKLIRRMNYIHRQRVVRLMKEAEEQLISQIRACPLEPGDFHQNAVIVGCDETDYAITLIARKCDSCSIVHIEVLKVEQFILN